mgnify:CR=1 FL=1
MGEHRMDDLFRLALLAMVLLGVGCSDSGPSVALGTLERERIDLVADSNEPITRVLVSEGQSVAAGEVLVVLDTARPQIALTQALAKEAAARSVLAEAEKGPRQQQIEQARSRLRAAKSARDIAQVELDRILVLIDRQLVAANAVDLIKGRHTEAVAKWQEARSVLDELLEGTRTESIDQARAQHAVAISEVDNLRLTLTRAQIIAPISGTIESLPFELGERPPLGVPIVTMLAEGPTYARIHVSAEARGALQIGHRALIRLDGREQPLTGSLRFISSQAAFTPYFALNQNDRSRLSYLAKVNVDGEFEPDQLPVGIPVEVTFPAMPNDASR